MLERAHRSLEERIEVGRSCMTRLSLGLPALVDEMDDAISEAWAAMPERLYLVGRDGRIAYKGDLGPLGFDPDGWERAIAAAVAS